MTFEVLYFLVHKVYTTLTLMLFKICSLVSDPQLSVRIMYIIENIVEKEVELNL